MSSGEADLTSLVSGSSLSADELITGLGLRDKDAAGDRPHVVAAMIASADGRAAVEGRSVALGHPADRALLRGLRAAADAVLVGTATVRAERYANLLDPGQVAARELAGLESRPLIAMITRSGDIPWDVGLFAEPETHVAVYTGTPLDPPHLAATIDVHDVSAPAEVLTDLRSRYGARAVLCEGGPRLLRALVAEDLLDELLLTIAPMLAAGDAPTPLAGPALLPPARMSVAGTWRAGDHTFLRYLPAR
jgi:riboflavin biosynthesis pyrimidine reductase